MGGLDQESSTMSKRQLHPEQRHERLGVPLDLATD